MQLVVLMPRSTRCSAVVHSADGVEENLATRDQRDSTRKAAPLKVVEGATVINNSGESPEETSARIIALVQGS